MTAHPTPSGPSRRSLRGRLLVVGSSPSVEQFIGVAQACVGSVSRSTNLFDAIADISRSSDREPIAAVAVSSDCADFDPAVVIEAIQAVDRSVPVFLLYPRGEEMSAIAIREGYEDTIPLPAVDDDVREALAPIGLAEPARDARPTRPTPHRPIEMDASADAEADLEASIDAEIDLDVGIRARIDEGTLVDSQIRRAIASAHPESPVIGDATSRIIDGRTPRDADADRAHPSRSRSPSDEATIRRRPTPTTPLPPTTPTAAPAHAARTSNDGVAAGGRPSRPPERTPSTTSTPAPRPGGETASHPRHDEDTSAEGDIALVRCLRRGKPLRETALAELRRVSGMHDVRLARVARPGEETIIAREREGLAQAPVIGECGAHGVLLSGTADQATLHAWANWLAEWLDLEHLHTEYRRLSSTDQLTGALNRRAFDQMVPALLEEARTRRRDVSLMYFDIDDFKRYNDNFGHVAGDEVLREAIAVLRESIRSGDLVFRMGGDEFVVLFCDPNPPRHGGSGVPEHIEEIAERCRAAVRRMQVPLLADSGPGPVTISAGCAVFPWDATDASRLLAEADARALEAKKDGKDQINFGPERLPDPRDR